MEPKEGGGFVPCSVETAAGILLRTRLARALLGSTILEIYYGNRSNKIEPRMNAFGRKSKRRYPMG